MYRLKIWPKYAGLANPTSPAVSATLFPFFRSGILFCIRRDIRYSRMVISICFLKNSTTFTFTNIHMCCYIIQIDVTAVILFHVRKHFPETFQMHCALRFCMRSFSIFPVQIIPDSKDADDIFQEVFLKLHRLYDSLSIGRTSQSMADSCHDQLLQSAVAQCMAGDIPFPLDHLPEEL